MERYALQKRFLFRVIKAFFYLFVVKFQIMEVDKSGPITVLVQVFFGFNVFSAEPIKLVHLKILHILFFHKFITQ